MINKAIGGYFELETPVSQLGYPGHNSIALNSARNCLEYILRSQKKIKIYIPFYTCDVILEPINKVNLEYEFYDVDFNLEPLFNYENIKDNETFLYTNYFGIKDNFIKNLVKKIPKNIIIDNAQALFSPVINDIDQFYSPRKFVGVADGGFLFTNQKIDLELKKDESYQRMSHLLKRIDLSAEQGYTDFSENDKSLQNQPIKKMSNLTEKILSGIDYENIKKCRRENFFYLHNVLQKKNKLSLEVSEESIPLIYPFRTDDKNLRQKLINKRIYCATYWPNVLDWCDETKNAYTLTKEVIALPIDQRYSINEMKKILECIMF
ncbi:hypothetical protein H3Z85_09210 [Chryseobacterium indologenes]|uniref:hypothetical protein n=1 Tax=Chryseobacterium indologenes TaxID=253 RepID=UPI0003E079D8|nr:hypothetical protein [Chryseobacterium indologenes]QPQ53480.1 hypothetical protein H3Z85_09210 [Chryseobacterium indologenes]GAE63809.1 hypothetical protein CIN01S_04_04170 [Chryseobacterium indologenes NBRC 14944]SFJ56593.1 dTDP-4-amino-4,6-dideoxygalactose transaminase [Chryseobacterium indologenes]SUX52342.1 Uncharacterised protein [Chryseobacterium indologenes]